ncbi:hypothetical protein, partial [Citrobacter braakii]|uniref:hypothetical protein n=1 Tax=Citrobacter braakii TaxID=57706 RepID=UPI0029644002
LMMNPVPWLQMTNMISYQGLVRTFLRRNGVLETAQNWHNRMNTMMRKVLRVNVPTKSFLHEK